MMGKKVERMMDLRDLMNKSNVIGKEKARSWTKLKLLIWEVA